MISIDRTDRDILAAFAAGETPQAVAQRFGRQQRVRRLLVLTAHRVPSHAGRLVGIYDQLAARPVAELSPLRLPRRVAEVPDA